MDLQIKIKRIIYRATYRGCREMELLLRAFINKNLNSLHNPKFLSKLEEIIMLEDEVLYKLLKQDSYHISSSNPKDLIHMIRNCYEYVE